MSEVKIELTAEAPKKVQIAIGDEKTGIREKFVKGTSKSVSKTSARVIIATNPDWFTRVEEKQSVQKTDKKATAKK